MRGKLTVVGAGELGATVALLLAQRDYAELVLLDADGDLARARALDVARAATAVDREPLVTGTADWSEAAGASVAVVTGDRSSVEAVCADLARCCPDAIVVVASEPVGEICRLVRDATLFPRPRVIGAAGVSAAARIRTAIARELDVSARDVTALVVGGDDDALVPVVSHTTAGGAPVAGLLGDDRLREVIRAALAGPAGSAVAGAAAVAVVDAVAGARGRLMPCNALCQGEYGVDDRFAVVPVRVGREGIEEIVEIDLGYDERAALARVSARAAP